MLTSIKGIFLLILIISSIFWKWLLYLILNVKKLISKLNNKIVVQNDDNVLIFTLKNDSDSERFIDTMSNYFIENKKTDCILVKDTSIIQRKYLYDLLTQKGFPKNYLFRHSTTHPK